MRPSPPAPANMWRWLPTPTPGCPAILPKTTYTLTTSRWSRPPAACPSPAGPTGSTGCPTSTAGWPTRDFRRPPLSHPGAARLALHHYPKTLEALLKRHLNYNQAVEEVLALEEQGKALLLAPADIDGISTLRRNGLALDRLYGYGYQDGAKLEAFLSR